jgi:hypothetical protein
LAVGFRNLENKGGIGPLEVFAVTRAKVMGKEAVEADELLQTDLIEESL